MTVLQDINIHGIKHHGILQKNIRITGSIYQIVSKKVLVYNKQVEYNRKR